MKHPNVRVLIVDDHYVVRKGLEALLHGVEGLTVVGHAGNGLEAVAQAQSLSPDVILMDLLMPEMDGVEATGKIVEENREIAVLILTATSREEKLLAGIRAGALGYVPKDFDQDTCVDAIRRVSRGEWVLPKDMTHLLLQDLNASPPAADTLTPRELAVLRLVAQGLSDDEISQRLYVSRATVRSHISKLLSKLNLRNRVEATLYALREGLVVLGQGNGDVIAHKDHVPRVRS